MQHVVNLHRNTHYTIIPLIILLYLILNKIEFRCFCVLTSIRSGLRLFVNLETGNKALRDLKRPKQSRRRLSWTIWGPKLKSSGPQHRPLDRPKSAKKLHKGRCPERLAASKNRPGRDLCSKQVPGIILFDFGSHLGDRRLDVGTLAPPRTCLGILRPVVGHL
jgi:hypothetical protein